MAVELTAEQRRWNAHIENLRQAPQSKVLSSLVVLGSEIFLLKAEIERLKIALGTAGLINEDALDQAGTSSQLEGFLGKEQIELNEALFKPWLQPDDAPDSSVEYEKEL